MKDFFNNDLNVGDYVVVVTAESGEFTIAKIITLKEKKERVGIISVLYEWPDGKIGIGSRIGYTFPRRCITYNVPQKYKDALDEY